MLTEKKHEKLNKLLGKETIQDLEGLDPSGLKARIAKAEGAIKAVQDELQANPEYVAMKEALSALSAGLKEVTKRQKGITQYSLHLLEEKGQ